MLSMEASRFDCDSVAYYLAGLAANLKKSAACGFANQDARFAKQLAEVPPSQINTDYDSVVDAAAGVATVSTASEAGRSISSYC